MSISENVYVLSTDDYDVEHNKEFENYEEAYTAYDRAAEEVQNGKLHSATLFLIDEENHVTEMFHKEDVGSRNIFDDREMIANRP